MSEPKRYKVDKIGTTEIIDCVSYEDYARLKAECQARQAENSVLAVECDSLKSEVERLTKGHSIDFVRAEMYRHLLEENAKLKEEVMRMRNDAYKEGDILQKCCEHQKNRIERLKAEVERLTELNATLSLRYDATKSMLEGCAKEIEEMEAEVENSKRINTELLVLSNRQASDIRGLTKAGDALHCFLIGYIVENRLSSSYLNKLDDDWNKALNKNLP